MESRPKIEIYDDSGQLSHLEGFVPHSDEGAEPLTVEKSHNLFDRFKERPALTVASLGALAMGVGLASGSGRAILRARHS